MAYGGQGGKLGKCFEIDTRCMICDCTFKVDSTYFIPSICPECKKRLIRTLYPECRISGMLCPKCGGQMTYYVDYTDGDLQTGWICRCGYDTHNERTEE